jgi:hypothetical protein
MNMTNFLSFDVYYIDLSKVMNDSNLNFVLLQTTSKSIIAIENLDRFLTEKSSTAMSLFIDVHIHFPLCDFLAFKTLANSYLWLKDHKLFYQVDDIFQRGTSNQRVDNCASELVEPNYKIGYHGVANGR